MPIFTLLFFVMANFLHAAEKIDSNHSIEFPVLAQSRFRPAEAYSRLWLFELYHAPAIKKEDLYSFNTQNASALNFLWRLNFLGASSLENDPLFWIGSAEDKINLGLNPRQDRWSYRELKEALVTASSQKSSFISNLTNTLMGFEQIIGTRALSNNEQKYFDRLSQLQEKNISPTLISNILEQEYPLAQRLKNAGILFRTLPGRHRQGEWFPINALKVKVYRPELNKLGEVNNFTLYSDEDFNHIRQAYLSLEEAYFSSNDEEISYRQNILGNYLFQAYQTIAGSVMQEAYGKSLKFPSQTQLIAETFYVKYPWILFLIFLYGFGAVCLIISYQKKMKKLHIFAMGIIFLGVICHSILLGMRIYILNRPPVSNMFETVIYVPWIASVSCLLFPNLRNHFLALLSACFTSMILLLILHLANLNQNLEQVQAVLDSQFWLLIHVLLVVGSYGVFILGAMLAHFYLLLLCIHRKETPMMHQLIPMILQTLYGGTALLISGTILGGIWAAESWGRFWDWDPKESWAFISSCYYLICIHAYRFNHIGSFGLAWGAVGGLLAISFTWYGVNYLLGSGLHSYGFGMGGEFYYYAFLMAECLFLSIVIGVHRWNKRRISLEINLPKST